MLTRTLVIWIHNIKVHGNMILCSKIFYTIFVLHKTMLYVFCAFFRFVTIDKGGWQVIVNRNVYTMERPSREHCEKNLVKIVPKNFG